MGHGAWAKQARAGHGPAQGIENSFFFCQLPTANCQLPTARGLIAKQLFADLGGDKRQL